MSSLKAELIPDESRAAVMSLLRVPMNIGVCAILWQVSQIGLDNEKKCRDYDADFESLQVDSISMTMLFAICAFMNAIGAVAVGIRLRK
jgi:hypothetical protein